MDASLRKLAPSRVIIICMELLLLAITGLGSLTTLLTKGLLLVIFLTGVGAAAQKIGN